MFVFTEPELEYAIFDTLYEYRKFSGEIHAVSYRKNKMSETLSGY